MYSVPLPAMGVAYTAQDLNLATHQARTTEQKKLRGNITAYCHFWKLRQRVRAGYGCELLVMHHCFSDL